MKLGGLFSGVSNSNKLRILDLFAGTGSSTQAFVDRGHYVLTVEIDSQHNPDILADVTTLNGKAMNAVFGPFDFVWASPPCTAFSVASIGTHWAGDSARKEPKTDAARQSQNTVAYLRTLIDDLNPRLGFIIENPRGILRKLDVMSGLHRSTVTYCQYGDSRMKPTDLWGGIGTLGWLPDRRCVNGSGCHVAAPRGSKTGTQGISGAVDRSRVPYQLSWEIALMVESAADEQVEA